MMRRRTERYVVPTRLCKWEMDKLLGCIWSYVFIKVSLLQLTKISDTPPNSHVQLFVQCILRIKPAVRRSSRVETATQQMNAAGRPVPEVLAHILNNTNSILEA